MAYITSYNTHKIVIRNNFKNVNLSGQVYRFKIYMFSKYEENCLLAIQELENKIDSLIKEAGRYYYDNEKNTTILKDFGKISGCAFTENRIYNNNTGYTDDVVKAFLKDYHRKYKLPIRKLLIEYYRIKFNPDLKFADNYMEVLGFKKCECCKRDEENRYFLNLSENDRWGFLLDKSQEKKKELNKRAYQYEEADDLPF